MFISHLPSSIPHSSIFPVRQTCTMSPSDTPVSKPEAGEVTVVLLQHWGTMIATLTESHRLAAEQARIGQHQVHVLSREITNLNGQLLLQNAEHIRLQAAYQHLAQFASSALMWIPNITQEHFLVKEYNDIIDNYNRENVIDLTETDSDDE